MKGKRAVFMALSFPARRRERAGLFCFFQAWPPQAHGELAAGRLDFYHKPVKTTRRKFTLSHGEKRSQEFQGYFTQGGRIPLDR
jgi:hypothetical protein